MGAAMGENLRAWFRLVKNEEEEEERLSGIVCPLSIYMATNHPLIFNQLS